MKADFDRELDRLLRGHTKVARRGGDSSASAPSPSASESQTRGNGHDSPATEEAAHSAHLDGDEMVAYAENALPEVARSRYVAHLADCDRCRKIVTGIALASGVPVERSDEAAATTNAVDKSSRATGWREWLAALFAPRTLRYAAPVLALSLIGVVAFVAIRQQSGAPLMSRQNETSQPFPSTATQPAESQPEARTTTTTATTGTTDADGSLNTSATRSETGTMERAPEAKNGEAANAGGGLIQPGAPAAPPPASLAGGVSATTTAAADTVAPPPPSASTLGPLEQRAASEVAKKEAPQNEPVAASPRPAPSAYVLSDDGSSKDKDDVTRTYSGAANTFNMNRSGSAGVKGTGGGGEAEQSRAQSRQSDELRIQSEDDRRRDEERGARKSTAPAVRSAQEPAARRRARQSESSSDAAGEAKETKREAKPETRSVAGRKFLRQSGGAWIDTAYRSSQSVTNVSRGSEQFRALIADEPDIARISRELGGEVILVWKGRAYRIR